MAGELTAWSVVRFLHVTAAIVWVGGQLTLSLVVTPAARRALGPPELVALLRASGTRFARLANRFVLPLAVATGIALASHRGVALGDLTKAGYGRTLGTKIVVVAVTIALALVHGAVARRGNRRVGRYLAMTTLATSLVIILLATALVG